MQHEPAHLVGVLDVGDHAGDVLDGLAHDLVERCLVGDVDGVLDTGVGLGRGQHRDHRVTAGAGGHRERDDTAGTVVDEELQHAPRTVDIWRDLLGYTAGELERVATDAEELTVQHQPEGGQRVGGP